VNARQILVAIGTVAVLAAAQGSMAQEPMRAYDKTFLTNYDLLKPRAATKTGQPGDLAYIAPGAIKRLAGYNAVMVDQPELLFSPDSEIKGMKPDDLKALSEALRNALSGSLAEGGYSVTQKPGPGVVYLRVALTDMIVKKKKRGLLAYTPAGAVVKAGTDLVKETFDKVDFIELNFQAEIVDSLSNDVLAALVAPRGTRKAEGQKETRIDMDEMRQNMRAWSHRLRCQLDNSKLPEDKQTNCADDDANKARYDAK
jgi:Protein of unknown function (DUF3313)